jgi:phage terminase large subunit
MIEYEQENPDICDLKTSKIFLSNYEVCKDYGNDIKVVVNQGGTSSGKTYSLMQLMIMLCLRGEKLKPDKKLKEKPLGNAISVRVVAKHYTSLRRDAIPISIKICEDFAQKFKIKYNISTSTYKFRNGSTLQFMGVDSVEKAKFGKYDYTYICEATSVLYEVFDAMAVRTMQLVFIDYNPSIKFWVHTKVIMLWGTTIRNSNVVSFLSTYKDNNFLSDAMISNIESRKWDTNWWRVYGEGKTGRVDGLVFPNWQECDSFPVEAENLTMGLDFGFTNDPTVLVLAGYFNGSLYVKEFLYGHGLSNIQIAQSILNVYDWLKGKGCKYRGNNGEIYVVADSAAPSTISEIKHCGERKIYIQAAKKGAGSILSGINYIQSLKLYIDKDSENLKTEFSELQWAKNKNGDFVNATVGDDHFADALRYALENNTLRFIDKEKKTRTKQLLSGKNE